MTRSGKRIALALTLLLALALLAACGKDGGKAPVQETAAATPTAAPTPAPTPEPTPEPVPEETPGEAVTGKTAEYGSYTVLVPEGFQLKEPGEYSYYDFSVQRSEFSFIYFITEDDNEAVMEDYNYNKKTYTNEQEDVEATYGANTWTGFQYSDGWGGYGFEVYTALGEKLVRVSSCGFTFDSPVVEAVLSSFAAK